MAPFICPAIPKVDDQFHRLANASVGKVDGFGRTMATSKAAEQLLLLAGCLLRETKVLFQAFISLLHKNIKKCDRLSNGHDTY